MTSRGNAVGTLLLATLLVACGSGDDDDDDTPQLRKDGNLAAKGGTRAISAAELESLRGGACSNWSETPRALPTSLMLVVDVSSSMQSSTNATGGRSKWEVTREALINAINSLPPTTQVGLLLYPNMNAQYSSGGQTLDSSSCVNSGAMVKLEPLGEGNGSQRTALNNALERARLSQSTPTHDAYFTALDAFASTGMTGNGFVIVITDGQPTLARGCVATGDGLAAVDPEPIVAEALNASNQGIYTFFIGSPGSEEARPWLSRAAQAGGTAYVGCSDSGPEYCHFDMTTEADFAGALNDALAQIAGSVVSCSYPIPPPPEGQTFDPDMVNLVYTTGDGQSVVIFRNEQSNCDVGWQYAPDRSGIVLCKETCGAAARDLRAYVELFFGCETETVIL